MRRRRLAERDISQSKPALAPRRAGGGLGGVPAAAGLGKLGCGWAGCGRTDFDDGRTRLQVVRPGGLRVPFGGFPVSPYSLRYLPSLFLLGPSSITQPISPSFLSLTYLPLS